MYQNTQSIRFNLEIVYVKKNTFFLVSLFWGLWNLLPLGALPNNYFSDGRVFLEQYTADGCPDPDTGALLCEHYDAAVNGASKQTDCIDLLANKLHAEDIQHH